MNLPCAWALNLPDEALREQVDVIVGQKSLIKEAVEEEDLELLVEFRPSCVISLYFPNCNIFLLRVDNLRP